MNKDTKTGRAVVWVFNHNEKIEVFLRKSSAESEANELNVPIEKVQRILIR